MNRDPSLLQDCFDRVRFENAVGFTIVLCNDANLLNDLFFAQFATNLINKFFPPEGEVGRNYQYDFLFSELANCDPQLVHIEIENVYGLQELGLSVLCRQGQVSISGVPALRMNGEFCVHVCSRINGALQRGHFDVCRPLLIKTRGTDVQNERPGDKSTGELPEEAQRSTSELTKPNASERGASASASAVPPVALDSREPSTIESRVPVAEVAQDSSLRLAFRIKLEKCLTKEDFSAIRTFYEKIYNFKPRVGKVKEKYFETLDFTKVVIPYSESITLERTRGFEEIGLECKFNPKEGIIVIQGTPRKGYDGIIRIRVDCHVCKKRFVDDKTFRLEGEFIANTWDFKVPLIINPDPWELWEGKSSRKDEEYWKEDVARDSATCSEIPNAGQSHENDAVLRFTFVLQNKTDNDVNYYQTKFADSIRNIFNPSEGEVGREYRYVLSFDAFCCEANPDEWRFNITDVQGFEALGLRVGTVGYRLVIEGIPKVAFDGKIVVKVLSGITAHLENGSFNLERAFRIFEAQQTKDRQSYCDDAVMQTTEPSREKPYYVDVIRTQMSRNKHPGGREEHDSSVSLNPNLTQESRQSEIISHLPEPVASEWKNLPHPLDAPYQVDDQTCCAESINIKNPLTVLAASQRGRSHAHEGKFRDDAFRIAINREATIFGEAPEYGWHVFVVSDGAGSAKYSRKGAQLICDCVADKLSYTLNRDVAGQKTTNAIGEWIELKYSAGSLESSPVQTTDYIAECKLDAIFYNALSEAYFEIWKETKRLRDRGEKADVADFSATALCVAIKRFISENGDWKKNRRVEPPRWAIASYWIGDGAIALYRPNFSCDPKEDAYELKDDLLLLGRPDVGETRFLTARGELDSAENVEQNLMNVRNRMTLTFVRSFEALFMATDGVTDPFFEVEKELADFSAWRQFWNGKFAEYFPGVLNTKLSPRERAQALLDGMMFSERGYHDDRTVLVALNDIMVERENNFSCRLRSLFDIQDFQNSERPIGENESPEFALPPPPEEIQLVF